ncbi:hypothetical protein GGR08_000067 [Bartonella fuyuanensis]|uniref:TrwJ3 protein n=1 Tax=Bartonella fuyuanensis TaxID=1460968 RepID=A0A840E3M4_9HYPH|nr:hypothetical protein [Bartonella fuyuanensis]MBB4075786.1 hypothetical protein [Bartonella fuyuanensis]
MKKLFILIGAIAFIGALNSTLALSKSSKKALSKALPQHSFSQEEDFDLLGKQKTLVGTLNSALDISKALKSALDISKSLKHSSSSQEYQKQQALIGTLNSAIGLSESLLSSLQKDPASLFQKQLEISKKQLKKIEETYKFLAGEKVNKKKNKNVNSLVLEKNNQDFYFQNPQFIYDRDKQNNIFTNNRVTGKNDIVQEFSRVVKSEVYPKNYTSNTVRTIITRRKQYADFMDKTVALRVFLEIENRFRHIAETLAILDQMQDLKSFAKLQIRMNEILAMTQNEATKLQMIAYSRTLEQALINRLQNMRNTKILSSTNTKMPQIRNTL